MDGQSGDLYTSMAGIHLPGSNRQQQATPTSVAIDVISTIWFICCLAGESPVISDEQGRIDVVSAVAHFSFSVISAFST